VKPTSIVVLVVAVTVGAVVVARFRSSHGASAAPASLSSGRQIAPEFALESLDGKPVHLSDFRGKDILLNFWATWCQPCKIEMPWFEQFEKQYGPQGLQVIGVAMDDGSKEDIAKFTKNLGVDYPILRGKESVGDAYGGVQFLPATFYIARDGKVVDEVFGLKGRDEIEDIVKKTLGR